MKDHYGTLETGRLAEATLGAIFGVTAKDGWEAFTPQELVGVMNCLSAIHKARSLESLIKSKG